MIRQHQPAVPPPTPFAIVDLPDAWQSADDDDVCELIAIHCESLGSRSPFSHLIEGANP